MRKAIIVLSFIVTLVFMSSCNINKTVLNFQKQSFEIKTILSGSKFGLYQAKTKNDLNRVENELALHHLFDEYTESYFLSNQLLIYLPEDITNYILIDNYYVEGGVLKLSLIDTLNSLNDNRLLVVFNVEKNKDIKRVEYDFLDDVDKINPISKFLQFDSNNFKFTSNFKRQNLIINNNPTLIKFNKLYPNLLDLKNYDRGFFDNSSLFVMFWDSGTGYSYHLNELTVYHNNFYLNINSSTFGHNVFTQYIFVVEVNQKIKSDSTFSLSFLKY